VHEKLKRRRFIDHDRMILFNPHHGGDMSLDPFQGMEGVEKLRENPVVGLRIKVWTKDQSQKK